jgi:ATP-binding cassette subfamily B protein
MTMMSRASMERIAEVLTTESKVVSPVNPVRKIKNGSIQLQQVDFSYVQDCERLSLMGVNLEIAAGQTVGIVGATGSGKSSLVQLIPRLYDPVSGIVRVGGVDVRDYDMTLLRQQVAMVLQNNLLFSGSIEENLCWGKAEATLDELRWACQVAQIDSFIMGLPQQYATKVEQGGVNFSGGQKQRLCLARAILKRPLILILDDATSAVDTQTEAAIQAAWQKDLPQMTKIIISQRIVAVRAADQIIVLDRGKVAAVGKHEQLLRQNVIYKEMYQSQLSNES